MFQEHLIPLIKKALSNSKPDVETFTLRLERYLPELSEALTAVYPSDVLPEIMGIMLQAFKARSEDLKRLDGQRLLSPDWFQKEQMLAYVCYTERFAGNFKGLLERLDYLQNLGVTYLHLMPFLQPRPAPNDGGYAVQDYTRVRSDLGSNADFALLTKALRERGMSVCLDLVLNHVAQEHEWAQKAKAGDATYQNYFYTYPDRSIPEQYEQNLPEVFPDFAPGNFTFNLQMQRWVWTTFNDYQWDVNWANPKVFAEFLKLILYWANMGVDVFRLDAIAFIWKRMGTNCQNLPEVHAITQALRAAVRIVAPAVLFKAEAIVAPKDLIHYLGQGKHHGKVSDLAYHNSLMVQIWSSLASRNTVLMQKALQNFPAKPSTTAWATYVRCHDDIGWAISDSDAAEVGLDGEAHRRFLSDFYAGTFVGSHARGLVFQENPKTGDRRISGSLASLNGLEQARDKHNLPLAHFALQRCLLAYAVVLGYGGIPLLYMGDELALLNDYSYLDNPEHEMDNRWVHRPQMAWDVADHLHAHPHAATMFAGLKQLIDLRKTLPQLHAAQPTWVLDSHHSQVLVLERPHPLGNMVQLYNFSEHTVYYPASHVLSRGITALYDAISGQVLQPQGGLLLLEPYARVWLLNSVFP